VRRQQYVDSIAQNLAITHLAEHGDRNRDADNGESDSQQRECISIFHDGGVYTMGLGARGLGLE
jgi:hypothetical protein